MCYHVGMMSNDGHRWTTNAKEAVAIQRELAGRVIARTPSDFSPRWIAGVDASCSRFSKWLHAAIVVWDRIEERLVEAADTSEEVSFPYIPGLLSFREAPGILASFDRLQRRPDLVFVDGNGVAHPRRLGIAAHLGLLWDLPTVGCAKSRLLGTYRAPGEKRGSATRLLDDGEVIGKVLRTKDKVNPLFVSVGHRISLEDATKWVLDACRGYRLPEPLRLAHQHAGKARLRHSTR
ncbi:MAG: deoxyribonuclease V [Planctomycetota bacterium]